MRQLNHIVAISYCRELVLKLAVVHSYLAVLAGLHVCAAFLWNGKWLHYYACLDHMRFSMGFPLIIHVKFPHLFPLLYGERSSLVCLSVISFWIWRVALLAPWNSTSKVLIEKKKSRYFLCKNIKPIEHVTIPVWAETHSVLFNSPMLKVMLGLSCISFTVLSKAVHFLTLQRHWPNYRFKKLHDLYVVNNSSPVIRGLMKNWGLFAWLLFLSQY